MRRLFQIANKSEKLIIGLISGTSVDGIDAALVRLYGNGLGTKIELLAFATQAYPAGLRERILAVSRPGGGSVDEICRLNVAVGECFAAAALSTLAALPSGAQQIDLIGSHGQTIHHMPNAEALGDILARGTLQIGEPSVIVKRTGIITVADFRPADMALGGQGAPLAPLMDYLLFRSAEKTRGLLNLGGIANLTFLKKGAAREEIIAYDTGPANMVIDGLMQKFYQRECDEDGRIASAGKISEELLRRLLAHPYFAKPFPKSTGREQFGEAFITEMMAQAQALQLQSADVVATATALTVESIWRETQLLETRFGKMDELIVSGGGSRNHTLVSLLQRKFLPSKVLLTDQLGIPGEAKEAMLMAILANETVSGNPGNMPSVTGAQSATVLGKICL